MFRVSVGVQIIGTLIRLPLVKKWVDSHQIILQSRWIYGDAFFGHVETECVGELLKTEFVAHVIEGSERDMHLVEGLNQFLDYPIRNLIVFK